MNSGELEEVGPVSSYYGLSRAQWYDMTPVQRVTHYNRQNKCEHVLDIESWPELLRESWSYDPYTHTAHMIAHKPQDETCTCQGCDLKIGISRETKLAPAWRGPGRAGS